MHASVLHGYPQHADRFQHLHTERMLHAATKHSCHPSSCSQQPGLPQNCLLLQKPSGLQDVYDNFPKWFAEGYRGKGHEVRSSVFCNAD
jgi:hypothetical protein